MFNSNIPVDIKIFIESITRKDRPIPCIEKELSMYVHSVVRPDNARPQKRRKGEGAPPLKSHMLRGNGQ